MVQHSRQLVGLSVLQAVTLSAMAVLLVEPLLSLGCQAAYFAGHEGHFADWLRGVASPRHVIKLGVVFILGVVAVGLASMSRRRGRPRLSVGAIAPWLLALLVMAMTLRVERRAADRAMIKHHAGFCVGSTAALPPGTHAGSMEGAEPAYTAHIDARGLRYVTGGEGRQVKLLLVGDSFTFGVGLEDDATVASRLAVHLPSAAPINAGLPGDNLDGVIARALAYVERDRPQALALLLVNNDLDPQAPFNDCALPAVCRLNQELDHGKRPFLVAWQRGERRASLERVARLRESWQRLRERCAARGVPILVHMLHGRRELGDALTKTFWDGALVTVMGSGCMRPDNLFGGDGHTNPEGADCLARELAEVLVHLDVAAPPEVATRRLRAAVRAAGLAL